MKNRKGKKYIPNNWSILVKVNYFYYKDADRNSLWLEDGFIRVWREVPFVASNEDGTVCLAILIATQEDCRSEFQWIARIFKTAVCVCVRVCRCVHPFHVQTSVQIHEWVLIWYDFSKRIICHSASRLEM